MLIDKIITHKTEYAPEDFTGGNIQYSVSKYTKQISIKLVLYFGFNYSRNPISKQIDIQEKDVLALIQELSIKTNAYLKSLIHEEVFDLDSFVKDSYECRTMVVRMSPNDRDRVDRVDRVDSDTQLAVVAETAKGAIDYDDVMMWWNESAATLNIPKIIKLTGKRKKLIDKITKTYTQDEIEAAMDNVYASSFLTGKAKTKFTLSFDWFFNEANILKVLEGNYNDKI